MKIILGQGNPGDKYSKSRHNLGWFILDAYAKKQGLNFVNKTKFHASMAEFSQLGEKIVIVKPDTFYNDTGLCVASLVSYYDVDPSDILVIHDDISLPLGTMRVRNSGSDAGNNGIKSITSHLATDSYWRLRIGIRPQHPVGNLSQYVLSSLNKTDIDQTNEILDDIHKSIDRFIDGSIEAVSISSVSTSLET